jgi:hypothetical protein
MNSSIHEQARVLLATNAAETGAERPAWLQSHLVECATCREYEAMIGGAIRALHSLPFTADADLIRTTMLRIRSRTVELRQRRERNRLVGLACWLVGVSAAIMTALLWRGSEWMAATTGLPGWVGQLCFALLWIAPALVVSAVLLARGSHLAHDGENLWR